MPPPFDQSPGSDVGRAQIHHAAIPRRAATPAVGSLSCTMMICHDNSFVIFFVRATVGHAARPLNASRASVRRWVVGSWSCVIINGGSGATVFLTACFAIPPVGCCYPHARQASLTRVDDVMSGFMFRLFRADGSIGSVASPPITSMVLAGGTFQLSPIGGERENGLVGVPASGGSILGKVFVWEYI